MRVCEREKARDRKEAREEAINRGDHTNSATHVSLEYVPYDITSPSSNLNCQREEGVMTSSQIVSRIRIKCNGTYNQLTFRPHDPRLPMSVFAERLIFERNAL